MTLPFKSRNSLGHAKVKAVLLPVSQVIYKCTAEVEKHSVISSRCVVFWGRIVGINKFNVQSIKAIFQDVKTRWWKEFAVSLRDAAGVGVICA